jgi:predicted transcriptional regulator
MKYKSKFDFIAGTLQPARSGAKKTHIMHNNFTSPPQNQKYIDLALSTGLLTCDGEGIYRTTEKGLKFLDLYEKIKELAPGIAKIKEEKLD